jgi:TonB family protein
VISYPMTARLAHVQGNVILRIQIGTDGHVTAIEPLSGSPMLTTAASDLVREWNYTPFLLNGVPTTATTTVAINYNLYSNAPEGEATMRLEQHLGECSKALREDAKPQDAIAVCRKAASAAESLTGRAYSDRRMAYIYYATALLRGQQAKEAVVVGERAIALVRQYRDNSSAAYAVTGQAKAVSGDLVGADTDLEEAESSERKALNTPIGQAERSTYASTLKSLLTLHAQVLAALGKPADAQKKRDEASKL